MSSQNEDTVRVISKNDSFDELPENQNSDSEGPVNLQKMLQKYMKIKPQVGKEFIAEAFGTFILVFIGCSGVAQFKFSSIDNPYSTNFFSVNVAFGVGAIIAILICGKVSGAHLNPAVSFSMFLTGRMSLIKFLLYSMGQFIGAFAGAVLVFLVYLDGLKYYKNGMYSLDTAGIFATYPSANLSSFGGFFDQVVGTAILIMSVLAITDKKNVEMPHGTSAILIGLILIVLGATMGYNCGYAINPARDLSPRLFTLIAGWGPETFSTGNYFFWIPIVGPMIGSLVGTVLYLIIISNNL